jgi:predicted  nucleic acid-binding Zn-ribbon protein
MLEVIEKLLILQDRDRKIHHAKEELSRVDPERRAFLAKAAAVQTAMDTARNRGKQIESERKRLELEVQGKKQQIEKYALQQFQTKKNDEYRALGQQIETCKADIHKLEDQEIELMEQSESVQKEIQTTTATTTETKKHIDLQIQGLVQREEGMKRELAELEKDRGQLAEAVEPSALLRYQRLLKTKGDKVVVGVPHGVCGGCHMKIPVQEVLSSQADGEIVACPNCSRILYYTPDMDMTVKE